MLLRVVQKSISTHFPISQGQNGDNIVRLHYMQMLAIIHGYKIHSHISTERTTKRKRCTRTFHQICTGKVSEIYPHFVTLFPV